MAIILTLTPCNVFSSRVHELFLILLFSYVNTRLTFFWTSCKDSGLASVELAVSILNEPSALKWWSDMNICFVSHTRQTPEEIQFEVMLFKIAMAYSRKSILISFYYAYNNYFLNTYNCCLHQKSVFNRKTVLPTYIVSIRASQSDR
jgi:hypothetical protein